jgi:two-component system OmpR family sensor kinase
MSPHAHHWRGHRHRHGRGTVYRRFYLTTLFACLASLALALSLTAWRRHGEWKDSLRHFQRLTADYFETELVPHLGSPAETQATLARIGRRLDAQLALYDQTQTPISASDGPLPAPDESAFERAGREGLAFGRTQRVRWLLLPLILPDGRPAGYLQEASARAAGPPPPWQAFYVLVPVLALIALLMVPATRSVTRPLEMLTASARRFGQGDFTHRVPVMGPEEIVRLGQEMNEMASRLSAMIHTQKQLLADVSHELRSPLARIQVALELARSQGGAEEPLRSIAADADELTRLVSDILASSRLDLRPESMRLREVDAASLLTSARDRAVEAGLDPARLSVVVPDDLPAVKADAELVAHALSNLLENARQHTPEGSPIVLGGERRDDRVRLTVRDHGPGIPPAELARLFEPFYRPDQSRTRQKGGGAGLGLSLVRRIAELHGAPPEVSSKLGEGSTFGFSLPVA